MLKTMYPLVQRFFRGSPKREARQGHLGLVVAVYYAHQNIIVFGCHLTD